MNRYYPLSLFRPLPLRVAHRGIAIMALAAGIAFAQNSNIAPPPPPFQPMPDPPSGAAPDPDLEPQVTITQQGDETREEVRMGGELKFIRVTPRHGRTYYLVPDGNGQNFIRRDSLDAGVKVAMWVLFSW